jgi:hypothetical protein
MANVQYLNCQSYTPYTGVGSCNLQLGLLKGWVAVPRGKTYAKSAWDTIVSTLSDAAQKNPAATRVFPIGTFVAFTDSSTDTQLETTEYGATLIVRDGLINWKGRTINGDFCYYKGMRGFHNKQDTYDLIGVYDNGLLGTYTTNATTGAIEFKGIRPSMINVPIFKGATGNSAAQYWFDVQIFDSAQVTDNALFIKTDASALLSIEGIQLVDIQNDATWNTSPAGSVDILPVTGCGGASLVDIFGSTLASASLWTAKNADTGNTVTLTGVTIVNGKYRMQQDTTDTDYPASGHKTIFSMADVATLVAAGVVGYESNTVSVAHP